MRSLRTMVRRRVRYRVTLGGALFAVALIFSGTAAFLSANNLLFLVFSALLALLVVSGFLSRLMLAGLEVELLLPRHVSAGSPTAAVVRVRNLKGHTPSFSLELAGRTDPLTGEPSILKPVIYFPAIPPGKSADASAQVTFARRGRHLGNLFVLSTRFPFGFLRRTTAVELRRETLVYPSLEPTDEGLGLLETLAGELRALSQGSGHDFHRVRLWESSDSARRVDWKATARVGQLHVREYEQEERRAVDVVLDRRAGAPDRARFEELVSQCAWLTWSLDEKGLDVRVISQGFRLEVPLEGSVHDVLRWLALVEPLHERAQSPVTGSGAEEPENVRIVLSCESTV